MAAPKSPRKPTFRDEVMRKKHAQTRRELKSRREMAQREAQKAARRLLAGPDEHLSQRRDSAMRRNSVVNGLLPRLRGAMNSYGYHLPLRAEAAMQAGGYTDFNSITIEFDERMLDTAASGIDTSTLRTLAGEFRGVFCHELGHNRFTVPPDEMLLMAADEGYTSPAVNYNLTFWDQYDLKEAWNILEDQRMESAVVEESPFVASYLTVLVMRLIATADKIGENFPLLVGRWYLPSEVLQASEALYNAEFAATVTADAIRDCVFAYCSATTATEMLQQVEIMMGYLNKLNMRRGNQFDRHDGRYREGKTKNTPGKGATDPSSKPQAGPSPTKPGKPDDSKPDDKPDGSTLNTDQPTKPGFDEDSGKKGNWDKTYEDTLKDVLDGALDAWNVDKTLTNDVASINHAYNNATSTIPYYECVYPNTDEFWLTEAQRLQVEMVEAFKIATADTAPLWVSEQRSGVLQPLLWATRQPGEMNIFRNYADHGDPGSDLSVKLLLDVSGSMSGTGSALGGAAWAVKKTCDDLHIECDVAVFDTEGYMIWSRDDQAGPIPNIGEGGGTDPGELFEDLLTDESEAAQEIVMIMTDGAWSSSDRADLRRYVKQNRHIEFFEYASPHNPSYSRLKEMTEDQLFTHVQELKMKYGPNGAHVITNLFTIPKILENLLVSIGAN